MTDFETEETTEYFPTALGDEPTIPLWPGMAKLAEPRDAQREWRGAAEEGTVLL